VEEFWAVVNNVPKPSKLPDGGNFYLFKSGITPQWEDPANANGGRWFTQMNKKFGKVDKAWFNLVLEVVREGIAESDLICGAIVGIRKPADRIGIWAQSPGVKLQESAESSLGVPGLKLSWLKHKAGKNKKKRERKPRPQEEERATQSGIGLVMGENRAGEVCVLKMLDNSPVALCERISLEDRIVAVGDVRVAGHSVEELKNLIVGPHGSNVQLTLWRPGHEAEFSVELTRSLAAGKGGSIEPSSAAVKCRYFRPGRKGVFRKPVVQDRWLVLRDGILLVFKDNPDDFGNVARQPSIAAAIATAVSEAPLSPPLASRAAAAAAAKLDPTLRQPRLHHIHDLGECEILPQVEDAMPPSIVHCFAMTNAQEAPKRRVFGFTTHEQMVQFRQLTNDWIRMASTLRQNAGENASAATTPPAGAAALHEVEAL